NWPPMNADERRYPDFLTEQVPDAIFEVSKTVGAGFLEKVYQVHSSLNAPSIWQPPMDCLIGVHRRASAANKGFEKSRPTRAQVNWPPINADERRYPDFLTEQVPGTSFEVSNTVGAGFLEKVYQVHSSADKGFEKSRPTRAQINWPPMNADERRCPD